MAYVEDQYITDKVRTPSRWHNLASWPLILILAWGLYKLTSNPALAVMAICAKFGWEDYLTGRWLRRRDSHRGRAWACYWLYLASGFWKMAITATLMIFGYLYMFGLLGAVGGNMMRQFAGAILATLGGILLATAALGLAMFMAWLSRNRLWLSPSLHSARRRDEWPPPDIPGRRNWVGVLVWTTLFAALTPFVVFFSAIVLGEVMGPARVGPIMLLLGWIVILEAGLLGLLVRHVFTRLFAESVDECWGAHPQVQETEYEEMLA